MQPTVVHYFLRLLHDKDLLLRTYTQVNNHHDTAISGPTY